MPMKKWFFFCLIFFSSHALFAQRGEFDTIRVGAIIVGKDTFIHKWLNEVQITAKAPAWLAKKMKDDRANREAYERLRYNVYLVYPYAVAASFILKDVDSVLGSLYSKEAKREFKRRKEEELNRKFKNELQDLSISQGQILVKLIARQTGKPCYAIVKQFKGGFNAGIFQAMALLFDNNLRNNYDATGEDATIEHIVQEIEARGHFEPKK